jgi:hypothetical protein
MNFTTLVFALVASFGAFMHPNDGGGGPSGSPQSAATVIPGPIRSVGVDDFGGPSGSPQSTATVIPGPIRSVGVDDAGGGPSNSPHP